MATLLALGDSLFAGWGLAPGRCFPARLEELLRGGGCAASVVNHGVSGDTAAGGLQRLERSLACRPDAALVEFGANECFQLIDPAAMEHSLDAILRRLIGRGVRVLLLGVTAYPFVPQAYAEAFNRVHPALARRHGIDLLPDIMAPYFHSAELLLPDGAHPNEKGVEAMLHAALPQVRALLSGLPGCAPD